MYRSQISSLPPSPPIRLPRKTFSSAGLLFTLLTIACARETTPPPPQPPPADVITRVTAAKTIFLSNAGANDSFGYEIPGGPNVSYNELYAALKQWGYFQLADTPSRADLIFQIRGAELIPNLESTASGRIIAKQHAPKLELMILDPHTQSPIDTLTVLAGRGTDIPRGEVAFAQSIEVLTYQIGTLVAVPRQPTSGKLLGRDAFRPSFESLIQSTAPIPPQVLNAKNIYVENDAPTKSPYYQALVTDLTNWGHYHLADTPTTADLVFHFHNDSLNGTSITLTDPATNVILWTITDPHFGFYRQTGEHRVAALTQNLISELKQLNGIPLTPAEAAALH